MNSQYYFLVILIICSGLVCEPAKKHLILDDDYDKIEDIVTVANCQGPSGKYVTEVHSSVDGSCYFYQKDESGRSPFIVNISSKDVGTIVDSASNLLDTIPSEMKTMIRGHEIHKMHCFPQLFFSDITFVKDTSHSRQAFEIYKGIDQLNNPVKITYNRYKTRISKIELLNPINTTETIQIINRKWKGSKYGKLVQEVDIVQAEKDTFSFVFNTIEINTKNE